MKFFLGNKVSASTASETDFGVVPTICLSGERKSSHACDSVRNSGLKIRRFFGYFFWRFSTVPGWTVDFTTTIFPSFISLTADSTIEVLQLPSLLGGVGTATNITSALLISSKYPFFGS